MKLVCVSDTHSLHDEIKGLPAGDVLIHAGDCTGSGTLRRGIEFVDWFATQKHKHKILIAGNHDFCFAEHSARMREHCQTQGVIYLEDESIVIDGFKFHGSPWTPTFHDMAFNASPALMREKMALVPDDTNVLITHGPALGVFDWIPGLGERVGSIEVARTIDRLPKLKVHICGHIHEGYGFGIRESDAIKFANASTCTESYKPTNPPIVIDLSAES